MYIHISCKMINYLNISLFELLLSNVLSNNDHYYCYSFLYYYCGAVLVLKKKVQYLVILQCNIIEFYDAQFYQSYDYGYLFFFISFFSNLHFICCKLFL
jgi:hypothetical protein